MTSQVRPEKILLMIPGPSEAEPEVLASLSLPTMANYGSQWAAVYENTLSKVQKVFKTRNEVILLPSPGQTAVEMAAASLVRKGQEAFVCANGFFSEMIVDILSFYGAKPLLIKAEYGKAVTPQNVKAVVQSSKKSKDPRCLFLVHNETSTGVTNPASQIMRICQDEGLISILDSISGFGGIDIRTDEWKVDYCIGYSSKAIGGVFGVIPVAISKDCWQLAKKIDNSHSRFLNLNIWRRYIDEWAPIGHPHPSSMPTNVVVALNTALDLALKEGLEKRYSRHESMARLLERGLEALGLEIFSEKKYASNTVTATKVDPKLDKRLRSELIQKYGIMIAGGLEPLRGKIIRIGHMGTSATPQAVSITLSAMSEILRHT
jgi:alanine-glyoxylate transaminase / serine-glyoxylate transaminase / serine-pyruvate transaminase